jgi:hypothetical protein
MGRIVRTAETIPANLRKLQRSDTMEERSDTCQMGEEPTSSSFDNGTEDRRAALDIIGFDWDPAATAWNEMFQRLVYYKVEHGDCNVPRDWKKYPSLGGWVGTQRAVYAELTSERRERLDAIGFDWDPLETAWNGQYMKLVKYKEEHGDCNVPAGWKKDPSLATWVATQRLRKAKLTDDRRNALDSLGFQWKLRRPWDDTYQRLVSYKKEYANCLVPFGWKIDRQLATWVVRQRSCRDALDDTQKSLLDEIGFDWNPNETVWKEMYERLVFYHEVHGHCNVPQVWEGDLSLGIWFAICEGRDQHSLTRNTKIWRGSALTGTPGIHCGMSTFRDWKHS